MSIQAGSCNVECRFRKQRFSDESADVLVPGDSDRVARPPSASWNSLCQNYLNSRLGH